MTELSPQERRAIASGGQRHPADLALLLERPDLATKAVAYQRSMLRFTTMALLADLACMIAVAGIALDEHDLARLGVEVIFVLLGLVTLVARRRALRAIDRLA
jgi:hypothetical protein